MNDGIKLRGIFRLQVWHIDGHLIEEYEDDNLIVNLGRTAVTKLIGGDVTGQSVTRISFGTNGNPPAANNTTIVNSFTKNVTSHSYPTINSVRFDWSLEAEEANGKAIAEFGLLTEDVSLFARKTREVINKNSDIRLAGTWTITF